MAIAQPDFVSFQYNQDGTWTVSLSPPQDVTGWQVSCIVSNQNGGGALITKTIGSGITVSNTGTGVFVVSFAAADLTLTYGPGAYCIQLLRTNAGSSYPITDPVPLVINSSINDPYPTLTNMGEYITHIFGDVTVTDPQAAQLRQLLFAAEDLLKNLCQRDFTYLTTLTEYYDGTGDREFQLYRRPVTSITSLYLDRTGYGGTAPNSFTSDKLLTSGTDYFLRVDSKFGDGLSYGGWVRRIGVDPVAWPYWADSGSAVWPSNFNYRPGFLTPIRSVCPGCIKVTYQAGYRLIPYRIKLAIWNIVTQLGQMTFDSRLASSESAEGHSVSFLGMEEQAMTLGSVNYVVKMLRGAGYFVA